MEFCIFSDTSGESAESLPESKELILVSNIRLTPAYFAMIGLYSTWFIRIGDGPLWKYRISMEQERCQLSWWKNLLYINNYIGNDQLCMFQSWYLAGKFLSMCWIAGGLIRFLLKYPAG